jgi:hypothetical protein
MKHFYLWSLTMLSIIISLSTGCGFIESEYEEIGNQELQDVGIETPFPERHLRESDGMLAEDILTEENYIFKKNNYQIYETQKGGNKFNFSTRLQWIYLFDDYVVMSDGNRGIDDGFFRYFLRPIYTRLNIFDRETFGLIDQKVIHGRVRNVIIENNFVYFNVRDYQEKGFYGKFELKE